MVSKLSAGGLADRIDSEDEDGFTLVDTRPEESFESWHAPGAVNVPYDPAEGLGPDQRRTVDAQADDEPVVAICGKGLTSTPFGFELDEAGYDVEVVSGGMEAWSRLYEAAPVATASEDLFVTQIQRRAKGCLGYVVGSRQAGEAVVFDPTRHGDEYKVTAQDADLTVEHVVDTHVHADHVSGGRTLADETGASYHLGAAATERGVQYEHEPLADGDVIEVGDFEIEALHTPGHTSEMTSYLVDGRLLLTGDTLFVDSVGRTELQFGESDASHGAELLYDSLHETVLDLPDDTKVLPGHLTVTADGRYANGTPGEPVTARLGALRRTLDLLSLDRREFVEALTEDAPAKPPNYERVIEANIGANTVSDRRKALELELGPNNCAA